MDEQNKKVAKRNISDLSHLKRDNKPKKHPIRYVKQLAKDTIEDIKTSTHSMDYILLTIIMIIAVLGTIMVYSASYPYAEKEMGSGLYYLKKQIVFMGGGIVVMFIVSFLPPKLYKFFSKYIYGVSILLLLAVLVIGTSEGVAKRWIILGPISIQPSEIAKLAVIIALADYLSKYKNEVSNHKLPSRKEVGFKTFFAVLFVRVLAPLLILGIACALVLLESHLSGALIIGFIGVLLLFVAEVNLLWSAGIIAFGGGAAVGVFLAISPYAMKRITSMFNTDELSDAAWQTTQGLYAIGSGGFLGVGVGNSRLKYSYIYGSHTDFIFSIWCEETGFVGAIALIALYSLLVWRGIKIAINLEDDFKKFLAYGITFHVMLQVIINIMVVTKIIPNTGVTLPLFSYGGSSTIMMMAELGILLGLSRYTKKKVDDSI